MSEHEPTPEQRKPLHDNCNRCGEDYDLTPDNSKLWLHDVNPDCNHMEMNCPHCGLKTALFGLTDSTIEWAMDDGIEPVFLKYPSDHVLAMRLGYLGIELVQPVALTDRHEKLIGSFATALATTPDEYLYDLITDDGYNRPHPIRWN